MKISAKTRYGLRILLDIASNKQDKPRTISDIAESQQISRKFISPLVVILRRAGMIQTIRGVAGGIKLAKDPKDITLLDITNAMDGGIYLLHCLKDKTSCPRKAMCVTSRIWNDINDSLQTKFRSFSLQYILDQYMSEKMNDNTYSI